MRRGAAATVETPQCSAASHSTSRAPRPQRGGCGCGKMAVGKNKRISKGKKCGKKKTNYTAQPAPKLVHFEDCQGISVRGITL